MKNYFRLIVLWRKNRTLVRGFLWLLHFKVTKVGNWLEAVVVPKPVGGKRTNAFQNHRVWPNTIFYALHTIGNFSCVDCILQCTKMSLSAKFTYVLTWKIAVAERGFSLAVQSRIKVYCKFSFLVSGNCWRPNCSVGGSLASIAHFVRAN